MSFSNTTSSYHRPSLFGGFRFFPPVIKGLLISNTAIYLLTSFFEMFRYGDFQLSNVIISLFALYPLHTDYPGMPTFEIWQLFTYMFMHAGFMHLLFNMFALWMFGMELENTWGSKKFFLYYLLCGLGAGLSNLVIGPLFNQGGATVGASGAVYGILLAFGMLFPNRPIFLYFFIPIRAKYFVMIFMAIELYAGIIGTGDGIAHFAHLGGAAFGFFLLMIDSGKIPAIKWWNTFRSIYGKPPRYSTANRNEKDQVNDAKFYDIQSKKEIDPNQKIIDEILDKISRDGYQNLTEEEKKILFEASKNL
ncbi:MAG: rhomboid family intramembrane serine protease [Bacteroidota bacterium]|nr:rhomboid family intramembrane serine protease [Bacteroidota bacterium]